MSAFFDSGPSWLGSRIVVKHLKETVVYFAAGSSAGFTSTSIRSTCNSEFGVIIAIGFILSKRPDD
jgi:hypothetical protein